MKIKFWVVDLLFAVVFFYLYVNGCFLHQIGSAVPFLYLTVYFSNMFIKDWKFNKKVAK